MSDLVAVLIWWAVLFVGGLAIWPLALKLCPFGGLGFTFGKVLFPGLITLLLIWLSTFHILPCRPLVIWFLLVLLAAICWFLPSLRRQALKAIMTKWKTLLVFELFFFLLFIFGVFARGHLPGLDSLEKMMNIGFLTSLTRTDYLPAADMWFAGETINYYYGGHIAISVWIKLSGIIPATAYNLAMASVFALTGTLSFQIGYAVLTKPFNSIKHRVLSLLAGFSSFILVTLAGNGHAIIYDDKSPLACIGRALTSRLPALAGQMEDYWFPSSTRFIGYNPLTSDKTIHEFPSYSFLVADLHAHLINLVFVLAFLLFLLNWFKPGTHRMANMMSRSPYMDKNTPNSARLPVWPGYWQQMKSRLKVFLTDPIVVTSAFFLYVFQISNYWDFVMYFGLLALILLFSPRYGLKLALFTWPSIPCFLLQAGGLLLVFLFIESPLLAAFLYVLWAMIANLISGPGPSRLTRAGGLASLIFALSHLLALPFNFNFEPIGKTIRLVEQRTTVYQFLILWGLILLLALIIVMTYARARKNGTVTLLLILTACGFIFLLIPELVYVVDIYGGDFKRANTMFKFTYQAFVLLMLVIGMGPALLLSRKRPGPRLTAVTVMVLSLSLIWFPLRASGQWLGRLSISNYQGLDGTGPLRNKISPQIYAVDKKTLADYFAVIDWLNDKVDGQPTIVEAYGPSYTDHCLVSAFTGLPTVLGWETHEWLWRTTTARPEAYQTEVLPRQHAIHVFYTSLAVNEKQAFIEAYDVSYVVIGPLEQQMFGLGPADEVWTKIGDVAFSQGDVSLIAVFRK